MTAWRVGLLAGPALWAAAAAAQPPMPPLPMPQPADPLPPVQGPPAPSGIGPADPRPAPAPARSFGAQAGAVKWETAAIFAYMTASQAMVTKDTRGFHFQKEGWFGRDTTNLGVDKLTHAFNTYLLSEFLHWRMTRRSGPEPGAAMTAAVIATGLMAYSELWDAHKVSSGFSIEDTVFNMGGAGFSVLRNTVPGLKEKLDFRLLLMPNSDVITLKGKRHYEQQRFMLALTLSGFRGLRDTPLRYVELHAGYRASGFTNGDRARGETPRRRPFVGVGLNLQELFFPAPRSTAGRVARTTLDYIQIPYTAVHID